jgi:ribosomal-protein-alanine N-acetyltransferase
MSISHYQPVSLGDDRLSADDAPTMVLRALQEKDIDAVMEIEKHCFTTNWSREALMNEIGNPCAFYAVGVSEHGPIGYGGEWIIMDEAHITTIAVAPEAQGKRFGERLLVALLREARYRGARRATLEVRVSNHVALRLYAKYGFETVAIRRKYYQDTDEDALIMWMNDLFDPSVSWLLNQRFGAEEASC